MGKYQAGTRACEKATGREGVFGDDCDVVLLYAVKATNSGVNTGKDALVLQLKTASRRLQETLRKKDKDV